MDQTKIHIYIHCYVSIASSIQFLLSSLNGSRTQQKIPCERGLTGSFNSLRRLSDSQINPLEIPIALYQRRGNGVIGEEQYQINNLTKP